MSIINFMRLCLPAPWRLGRIKAKLQCENGQKMKNFNQRVFAIVRTIFAGQSPMGIRHGWPAVACACSVTLGISGAG